MEKLYYIRYKTGYLEDFMYKIDQKWGFFLSMIYEQPMYLDVFKLLKLCSECKIVFGIGNTETDSSFEDAFEFTPGYGGERVVFSKYFMQDELFFNHPQSSIVNFWPKTQCDHHW